MQNPRTGSVNPGALGLGQQTATNLSNFFMLLQFVAPMPFAVLSDMKMGRLQTLMMSMWYVYTTAMALFRSARRLTSDAFAVFTRLATSCFSSHRCLLH
jgi:hypothetical protein